MGRLSDGAGICPRMNATWRHLATVERAMGILLVVTGFCLLTGSVSAVVVWLLEVFPSLQNLG